MKTNNSNNKLSSRSKSPTPENSSIVSSTYDLEKVKILIRIRPLLSHESPLNFIDLEEKDTLRINKLGNVMHMKFSDIMDSKSNQSVVFDLIKPSIEGFINGINNTIFAYGQTGAGKTYTVIGNYPEDISHIGSQKFIPFLRGEGRGILPRAIEMLLEKLKKIKSKSTPKLKISFIEIYNEKIYDLLNFKGSRECGLEIRESKNLEFHIPDLTNIQINNLDEAIQCLMLGLKNRATGSTHANSKSSRSHCIFQINLEQKIQISEKNEYNLNSTLRIVDLAGSEKFKIPYNLTKEEKELRISELTSINGSLSTLGHCISALIDRNRTHIPFRNSKLTRVLSDSLSGKGKIWFIVCISPSMSASAETLSTLQFANRAKKAILDGRNLRKLEKNSIKSSENSSFDMIELHKAYAKEKFMREELEKMMLSTKKDFNIEKEFIKLKKENLILKETIKVLQQNSDDNIPSRQRNDTIESKSKSKEKSIDSKTVFMNKKVHFSEEPKQIDIFQNKTIKKIDKIKENNMREENYKNIKSEISDFWKNDEEDSIINELPILNNNSENMNNLQQKQKEFEKKFQDFFSFNDQNKEIEKNIIKQEINESKFNFPLQSKDMVDYNKNNIEKGNNQLKINDFLNKRPKPYEVLFKESQTSIDKFEGLKNAFSMANQNSESNFIDPSQDENYYRDEQSEIKGSMNSFLKNSVTGQSIREDIYNIDNNKRNSFTPQKIYDDESLNILMFAPNSKDNEFIADFGPNLIKKDSTKNNCSTSLDKSYKSIDSTSKKIQDKSINITNIVNSLQKEMSDAVKQLQLLQEEDNEIKMLDDLNESLLSNDIKFNTKYSKA